MNYLFSKRIEQNVFVLKLKFYLKLNIFKIKFYIYFLVELNISNVEFYLNFLEKTLNSKIFPVEIELQKQVFC